jgi:hypothetical protein
MNSNGLSCGCVLEQQLERKLHIARLTEAQTWRGRSIARVGDQAERAAVVADHRLAAAYRRYRRYCREELVANLIIWVELRPFMGMSITCFESITLTSELEVVSVETVLAATSITGTDSELHLDVFHLGDLYVDLIDLLRLKTGAAHFQAQSRSLLRKALYICLGLLEL